MPTWLGIDVGSSSVKVAVVRSAYRRTVLDALVRVDVTPGEGGVELATRAAVDAALAASGPPDAVAVAVEGTRATVRSVSLPIGAIKQVTEVLPFELESQIPFEMSESVFDYRLLPRTNKDGDAETATADFLVGVVRTEEVTKRIDAAREASGVEPEKVGLGGLPLANVLAYIPAANSSMGADAVRGPVVIIDLGARSSDVLVLDAGEPVFARTLSQGTDRIEATAPDLARELRLTIGAFRSLGGAVPERMFLCGGGSFRALACSFLSGELNLPCELLPAVNLELGPSITPDKTAEIGWYAKALGLALGLGPRALDLDLRKGPLAFERGFAWIREKIPVLAGLAMVVLVSFFFSAWAQLHAAALEKDNLEKALALVTKDVLGEETTVAARATELVGQQTTLNDDDPLPHADAFDVMVKLSEDIPVTMTSDIEELDVQKGHVVVRGVVATIADAQSIADALKKERCFADVKDPRTNQLGNDKQKYALDFDLRCPEDVRGVKKKPTEPAAAPTSSSGGK